MKNKNGSFKLSVSILLTCIIGATSISIINRPVSGLEMSKVVTGNTLNTNSQHEFIIDAPVKFYNDIHKIEKILNYRFKIPDFLPEKNKVIGFQVRKLTQKDSGLEIFLENSNGSFSFVASEGDPVVILEKIENEKTKTIENSKVESKKEPMRLGNISGIKVTLDTILPSRDIGNKCFNESKKTSEFFTWKDENIWYSLEYNSASTSEDTSSSLAAISVDDVIEIAKSIKLPEQIKNVDYDLDKQISAENPSINIYDRDDFDKAKNLLGFNPKFPLKINQDITIINSIVAVPEESDKKEYILSNYYSNKNGSITFKAQDTSKIYEDIEKDGNVKIEGEYKEIKAEKLSVNNNIIYKYSINKLVPEVNYLWREGTIYYSVTFYTNTDNTDEIVKAFVNSKTLDT